MRVHMPVCTNESAEVHLKTCICFCVCTQLARELLGRPASSSEAADLIAALKQASDVFATPEIAAAEAAQQVIEIER